MKSLVNERIVGIQTPIISKTPQATRKSSAATNGRRIEEPPQPKQLRDRNRTQVKKKERAPRIVTSGSGTITFHCEAIRKENKFQNWKTANQVVTFTELSNNNS